MIHPEQTPYHPPRRSLTEIDRDELVRQTLTELESRLGAVHVNNAYRAAFKVVVKIMRGMKP